MSVITLLGTISKVLTMVIWVMASEYRAWLIFYSLLVLYYESYLKQDLMLVHYPPITIVRYCKSIIGRQRCINEWYKGEEVHKLQRGDTPCTFYTFFVLQLL